MDAFLDDVLLRLVATSVQTAMLVALAWALTRALPRMPASTQCWLWWLVGVQALAGLFCAPVELPWLPAVATAAASDPTALQPAATAMPQTVPASAGIAWGQGLLALWLAGVALMLSRSVQAWRASRRLLRDARPADPALSAALAMAADAHGLRHAPRLRVSAAVTSPQLVGPWRPVLLLPAAGIEADALDMALTHELTHLQRRDLWWGVVPVLARHLFFFNPLLHLAVREYGIAREAACDAAVVAGHRRSRRDYGQLLLRLGVAPHSCAGLASASPTFRSLKRRLAMLQHSSHLPRPATSLLLAAVALVGVAPFRLIAAAPLALPAAPVPAPAQPVAADIRDPQVSRTPLSAADEADLAALDADTDRDVATTKARPAPARAATAAAPGIPPVLAPRPPVPPVPPPANKEPPAPPAPPAVPAVGSRHAYVIHGQVIREADLSEADRRAIEDAARAARAAGEQARRAVQAHGAELARLSATLGSEATREAMASVRRELEGLGPQIAQAQSEARRARAEGMLEQRRALETARAAMAGIDSQKIARDVRRAVDEAMRAADEARRNAAEAARNVEND